MLQHLVLVEEGLDRLLVPLRQVVGLVHHEHPPLPVFFQLLLLPLQLLVVGVDVAHPFAGHETVAPSHFLDRPFKRQGRLLGVGDHRQEQMGNPLVDGELEHLRIDHDDPYVAGSGRIEEGEDHGVDGDRFAGTGRARHEEMGHAGQVGHQGSAGDILAERQRQFHLAAMELLGGEYLPQGDHFPLPVGELDPHHALAGDRGDDPDGERLEGHGKIVGEAGDAAHLHPRAGSELVHGDDRAGTDLDDLPVHAEVLELLLQEAGVHRQGFLVEPPFPGRGSVQER